jgi:hypothetical protein
MAKANIDESGNLVLPEPTARERALRSGAGYWFEQRETELILHPRLPDIHVVYVEPATSCSLHCL